MRKLLAVTLVVMALTLVTFAQQSAARETATGKATGKAADVKPREVATGQASGKSAAAQHEVKSPRDAATGQASGKRTAKPEAGAPAATVNTTRSNIKSEPKK